MIGCAIVCVVVDMMFDSTVGEKGKFQKGPILRERSSSTRTPSRFKSIDSSGDQLACLLNRVFNRVWQICGQSRGKTCIGV